MLPRKALFAANKCFIFLHNIVTQQDAQVYCIYIFTLKRCPRI